MKEKLMEMLLADTLDGVSKAIDEKLNGVQTSFETKLDGLKTQLNDKFKEVASIVEEKPLQINFGTIEQPKTELVHSSFMSIMNILKSQKRNPKNIMMVGEAGSGKTHLANSIAKALNLKFYPMSVGLQTTKSDLLGFINAHGQYITSPIREAFENGGVLLLDEFDSTHAGVVTIINSLLANVHCSFPDKIVEKNDKFICIVACNTYGHGANIDYVGRNRLDGATLDRFIVVNVGYDEKLEEQLTSNKEWLNIIKQIRLNIEKQGIKMIVSPRASMNGADLLDAGFPIEEVLEMVIFKGADNDTKTKLLQGIKEYKKEQNTTEITTDKIKESECEVFEIKTNLKDINSGMYEITCVNSKIFEDMTIYLYDTEYVIHLGNGWIHQYTGKSEIYFAHGHKKLDILESNTLNEFFNKYLQNPVNIPCVKSNIVFNFIAKGCRNPYKTIVLKKEN